MDILPTTKKKVHFFYNDLEKRGKTPKIFKYRTIVTLPQHFHKCRTHHTAAASLDSTDFSTSSPISLHPTNF